MKKVTMHIQGMYCASCATNIQRSLCKVNGVKNVRVNMLMKKGYADVEDNVKEEDLKKAIKRAGYETKSIEYE